MCYFKDLDEEALKAEPLIYCHFASGICYICLEDFCDKKCFLQVLVIPSTCLSHLGSL